MVDGNARDFIEKLHYEDHYAIYNGEKFFFNGCQTKILENGTKSVKLEVYNLTKNSTVLSVTKSTATDCVDVFHDTPICNRKTFWAIESEIKWVDE